MGRLLGQEKLVIAEPSCAACGEKGCEYGFGPARAGVGVS
jgi:hypothetical protein